MASKGSRQLKNNGCKRKKKGDRPAKGSHLDSTTAGKGVADAAEFDSTAGLQASYFAVWALA
jgi:hypothetical protein